MLLSSSTYFIFLVAVFFLYWPSRELASRFQNAGLRVLPLAVILFANYFFYAKWDLFYLALDSGGIDLRLLFSGWDCEVSKNPTARKFLVAASIVMNLSLLATFKVHAVFPGELGACDRPSRSRVALDACRSAYLFTCFRR